VSKTSCAVGGLIGDIAAGDRRESWTRVSTYISIGLIVLVCRVLGSVVLPVYDDAFITFRYARNLAAGEGFVYNPTEWVLGTTSPLFGLLCSLFYRSGLPMPQSTVGLNILFDVLVFYLTVFAVSSDKRLRFAIMFGSLFALSPVMTRVCVGGMEMSAYLACSIFAVLVYARGKKNTASVLGAILYFVRPEALILLTIMITLEFLRDKKTAVQMSLLAAGTLIIPLLFVNHFYGQFLPESVISKSKGSTSLAAVVRQLFASDPVAVFLVVPAILGLVVMIRKARISPIVMIWAGLSAAAYIVVRPKMWSWYGQPVYYSVILASAIGLLRLVDWKMPVRRTIRTGLGTAVCIFPLAAWLFLLAKQGQSPVTVNVYKPLGSWCRSHVKEGDRIMASDIGAVGYYSNARIYDLAGLVTPLTKHYGSLSDLIQEELPDFLFLNSTRFTVTMMKAENLRSIYRPVARFSKNGKTQLDLDADKFPEHWSQDYLVFSRMVLRLPP
jgi:hypothetical protein